MKGINFFVCVQDLFDESLSPHNITSLLGSVGIKGNVLRGGIVLNMILRGCSWEVIIRKVNNYVKNKEFCTDITF